MPGILVVDDEEVVRGMVVRLLGQAGYAVIEARDGLSALESLRVETPDLVLTDIRMPGISGLGLLKVIRDRFPGVPCIAMSGTAEDVAEFDAFIQKPFDVHHLLRTVKTILEYGRGEL